MLKNDYMNRQPLSVGLVIPCFNEEKDFDINYFTRINNLLPTVSFYFVDDGSTDNTLSLLSEACSIIPSSLIVRNDRNLGKAESIRKTFMQLKSKREFDIIGFLDADGQIPLQEVMEILLSLEGFIKEFDILWATRTSKSNSSTELAKFRTIIGLLLSKFLFLGTRQILKESWRGALPRDTQCGFKLFKEEVIPEFVLKDSFETRWFFEWELMLRIAKTNSGIPKVKECQIQRLNPSQNSNIKLRNYLSIAKEVIIVKLLQIRLTIRGLS